MLIEKDARRHIMRAIKLEEEMKTFEIKEKLKGQVAIHSPIYDRLRTQFVDILCQLNAVANFAGKGRDDLTCDILIAAEEISKKISEFKSKSVRKLATQIKSTFNDLRNLLRKYGQNIDTVDPQLRNNPELADALLNFEKAWEKGKDFFINKTTSKMLITFSQFIEGLCEKHKEMQEKIDYMDADIFIIIPCLAILRALDINDKSLFNCYYPEPTSANNEIFKNIKAMYTEMKKGYDEFKLYNIIELSLLEKEIDVKKLIETNISKEKIDQLLHELKKGAILLQRNKPTDWNNLMETAMGII